MSDVAEVVSKTVLLFEQVYRGDVWRLEVCEHEGRVFANFRKWYWDGDLLKPTKVGITFPLSRLGDLYNALGAHLASSGPGPLQH